MNRNLQEKGEKKEISEEVEDAPPVAFDSTQQEYIHWLIELGHISAKRIQQLAERRILPKQFAKLHPPLCAACIHGKTTKKLWRKRGEVQQAAKVATKPGECIAVDQLESAISGFVGQL